MSLPLEDYLHIHVDEVCVSGVLPENGMISSEAGDCIRSQTRIHFLPMHSLQFNKQWKILFETAPYQSFASILQGLSAERFTGLLAQICQVAKWVSEQPQLSLEYLSLDFELVFVHPKEEMVFLIYWPLEQSVESEIQPRAEMKLIRALQECLYACPKLQSPLTYPLQLLLKSQKANMDSLAEVLAPNMQVTSLMNLFKKKPKAHEAEETVLLNGQKPLEAWPGPAPKKQPAAYSQRPPEKTGNGKGKAPGKGQGMHRGSGRAGYQGAILVGGVAYALLLVVSLILQPVIGILLFLLGALMTAIAYLKKPQWFSAIFPKRKKKDKDHTLGKQDFAEAFQDIFSPSIMLVSINTPRKHQIIIDKSVFVIGKSESHGICHYALPFDKAISRTHCRIVYNKSANRYSVEDLGSKNKTYLNHQPLPPHRRVAFQKGDVISIASYDFLVQSAAY